MGEDEPRVVEFVCNDEADDILRIHMDYVDGHDLLSQLADQLGPSDNDVLLLLIGRLASIETY